MVTRLRPVEIEMDFEDRAYGLGKTIGLAVTLVPGRDVAVRQGRVDLVCEVRYTESFTVEVPLPGSQGSGYAVSSVSRQKNKKHRDTYVHSSVAFLNDTQLQSGRVQTYNSMLEISPEPTATYGASTGGGQGQVDVGGIGRRCPGTRREDSEGGQGGPVGKQRAASRCRATPLFRATIAPPLA